MLRRPINDVQSYSDLFNSEGLITIVGIGSLVSEVSAKKSFEFSNFRLGIVDGWARIFNLASCRLIDVGEVRYATGEIAALSFGRIESVSSVVALLDISMEGLRSFLEREAGYEIAVVSYRDLTGSEGYALACAESNDEAMIDAWGPDYRNGEWRSGNIFYGTFPAALNEVGAVASPLEETMPIVSTLINTDGSAVYRSSEGEFIAMDRPARQHAPHTLPERDYVYPAPGYLRLCIRAHRKQGILDEFMNSTFLMDRKTTLNKYLEANPKLKEYVCDERLYDDRPCDRIG